MERPAESIMGVDVDRFVPASHLLGDLRVEPIEYEGVVDAAVVLVRVLDGDGDAYWQLRQTAGVSIEEAIGVLDAKRQTLMEYYLRGLHLPSTRREDGDD